MKIGLRGCFVMVLALLVSAGHAGAAVYSVTNANDSGTGSLRWAVLQANANSNVADTVIFNIPAGGGLAKIPLLSPLPWINDPAGVFIDGFTQPGAFAGANPPSSAVLTVQLDGSGIVPLPPPFPPSYRAHGLWLISPNNTVRGLIVSSFPHDGISVEGTLGGSDNNRINCNFVGTDQSGTIPLQNGWHNGFSGSLWGGIYIRCTPGNLGRANNNVVDCNLVSGNYAEGVGIANCPPADVAFNTVTNNYIGTDITGMLPIGNIHDGVYIGEGAHDNLVAGNVIGANGFEGVCIVGYAEIGIFTDNNTVTRNLIGLNVNRTPLANIIHGVSIGAYGTNYWGGYAQHNQVTHNTIAYNLHNGVMVWEHGNNNANADFNLISQNEIYSNGYIDPGYIGIDLQADGVTLNDYLPDDVDTGPNEYVNFPQIGTPSYNLGWVTISGTIQIDTSPTLATVELFKAQPDATGSNHGQGAVYLGSAIPNASGAWTITLFAAVYPGDWVTATTTDMNRNTSEFAENVKVPGDANWDFGDAPDPSYPTLLASDGARHSVNPIYCMGSLIDSETNGLPDATATGDDNDNLMDEDGVLFTDPLIPGLQSAVDVIASTAGFVDAWIDFDLDGMWGATEQILISMPVTGGVNRLVFMVPGWAAGGNSTFARFRYSSVGMLSPTGPAPDGEVEDWNIHIDEVMELDFGDALDGPYPTLFANRGAYHVLSGGLYLGASVDGEPDGQPTAVADGDDTAGIDDEDGVVFTSQIMPGEIAELTVVASQNGILDAWLDFAGDGGWSETNDRIFTARNVLAGSNSLTFTVPLSATNAMTFARFRLSAIGCPDYRNGTSSGEVEDYHVEIVPRLQVDIAVSGTNAMLSWNAVAGATYYEVYASDDVTATFTNNWTLISPVPPGATDTTWQASTVNTCRFYGVVAVRP